MSYRHSFLQECCKKSMKDNFASGIIDVQEEGNLMRFGCYSGTFYCSVPNSKYSSILRRRKRNPSFSERGSQRFFAENSSFLGPIARFSYLSTTAAIEKEKAAAPLLLPTQSPLRSNQESHQYCRTFSWLLSSLLYYVIFKHSAVNYLTFALPNS